MVTQLLELGWISYPSARFQFSRERDAGLRRTWRITCDAADLWNPYSIVDVLGNRLVHDFPSTACIALHSRPVLHEIGALVLSAGKEGLSVWRLQSAAVTALLAKANDPWQASDVETVWQAAQELEPCRSALGPHRARQRRHRLESEIAPPVRGDHGPKRM